MLSHSESNQVDSLSKGSFEEAEYPRLTPKIRCREASTKLPLAAHACCLFHGFIVTAVFPVFLCILCYSAHVHVSTCKNIFNLDLKVLSLKFFFKYF